MHITQQQTTGEDNQQQITMLKTTITRMSAMDPRLRRCVLITCDSRTASSSAVSSSASSSSRPQQQQQQQHQYCPLAAPPTSTVLCGYFDTGTYYELEQQYLSSSNDEYEQRPTTTRIALVRSGGVVTIGFADDRRATDHPGVTVEIQKYTARRKRTNQNFYGLFDTLEEGSRIKQQHNI